MPRTTPTVNWKTTAPVVPARSERRVHHELQHFPEVRQPPAEGTDVLRSAGQCRSLRSTEVPDLRKPDREAAVVLLAARGSRYFARPHRLPTASGTREAHLHQQPEVPDAAGFDPGPQPQRGLPAPGVAA